LRRGRAATAERPGVNELRVLAGERENEATEDLPGAPANTPNPEDARRILESIRTARQRADLVIVYQHNHVFANRSFSTIFTEGMPERLAPNGWLVKWTHDEIDAGADIVVMHGAPLLHGVEIYSGRPIFYDLGNFIYNVPPTLTYIDEPMAWESVVATVQFEGRLPNSPRGTLRTRSLKSISFRPVVLNTIGDGQPDVHDAHASNVFLHTRGLPAPATGTRAGYILQRLAEASKPFATLMELRGDTATVTVTDR
jgi:poly-gamma-glutamate capsule biosynthesis protein CapA/YwtB (metallophosphatase superfamily)